MSRQSAVNSVTTTILAASGSKTQIKNMSTPVLMGDTMKCKATALPLPLVTRLAMQNILAKFLTLTREITQLFLKTFKQDIGEHLIEARYDLGFTCTASDLKVTVGGTVIPSIEYTVSGSELTFRNKRIFLDRNANSGLATCTTEIINTAYRLALGRYTGKPRCGTDNKCSNSISCTYSNNTLTLNTTTGLTAGSKVHVCYEVAQGMENSIELPAARVANLSQACRQRQPCLR